jgi:hypothetical protein
VIERIRGLCGRGLGLFGDGARRSSSKAMTSALGFRFDGGLEIVWWCGLLDAWCPLIPGPPGESGSWKVPGSPVFPRFLT